MSVAVVIIAFIGMLFLVVLPAHEAGHFIASKRAGVLVEEFGIGFPPRLIGFKRGQTIYSLNLIPIGAFVRTPGESDHTVAGSLASKGPWARIGIYAAGPLVNLLLAFVILSVFFMLPTKTVKGDGIMVHSVSQSSPAEEAGIEPGDIILKIDDRDISEGMDVQEAINSDGGTEKTLLLRRGEQEFQLDLTPEYNSTWNRHVIGIMLSWGLVAGVEGGSPADEAGIMPGDTILGVDGEAVYSQQTLLEALDSAEADEEISLALQREDEGVSASLAWTPQDGYQAIGIDTRWVSDTHIESERLPIWRAIYHGGDYLVHIPKLIKESIPLIREDPSKALVGPIGAGQLTVEAVKSFGFSNVLLLAGIISVGLALFNFIPIPPLDGGGMLFGLIEVARRGKRLSPATVRRAYIAGAALLVALFVMINLSDILRLIRGETFMP
jgi:regulator of sigma E protease